MSDKQITESEMSVLERMCDDFSLFEVLGALACICHEKAEHIEQSYSTDFHDPIANMWRKRALQVQSTAEYLERMEFTQQRLDPGYRGSREFTGRLKR